MKDDKCFLIAEIGQAHDGSLGIAHSYIDALSDTGIDAIKFQTHIAQAESSIHEPFRINFSYEDKNRYEYWKRMEFSISEWKGLKEHCDEVGIEFISSPFSNMAVDLLEKIGVERYKISSGDINNFLLLNKIASTGKDVIISSGMSTYAELDSAVEIFTNNGNNVSLLQCTSKYPTSPEDVGLNVITEMQDRYGVKVGLSDHSGKIYPMIAATTLGAKILEFHVVFDRKMFGPDSIASINIDEVHQLAEAVRFTERSMNTIVDKKNGSEFGDLKLIFEKSLSINKSLSTGDIISFDDLESKKPSNKGIPSSEYKKVIGKKVNKDMECWSFLRWEDISE